MNKLTNDIELNESEAAFIEARRNSLLQKNGDYGLVCKARIPDGCGRNTKTVCMSLEGEYTIPVGADGALFAPTFPLRGTASSTYMTATNKYGGLFSIPLTAGDYQDASYQIDRYDDDTKFISDCTVTRATVPCYMSWRPIGYNMNIKSGMSRDQTSGTLQGGQLTYHPLLTGSASGGYVTGKAYGATNSVPILQVLDDIVDFQSPRYNASEGITVRSVFNERALEFHPSSQIPNRFQGISYQYDGDAIANPGDMSGNDATANCGRSFFPVAVLKGAAAGDTYIIKISLVMEVDVGFNHTFDADVRGLPGEVSQQFALVHAIANDTRLYPPITTGNSFWPSVREKIVKGRKVWKLVAPKVAKAAELMEMV